MRKPCSSLCGCPLAFLPGIVAAVFPLCPRILLAQSGDRGLSVQDVLRPFGAAGNVLTFAGLAVRKDENNFAVQLQDTRILRLRIRPNTKAYRGGTEVALDSFVGGDSVQAEAVSDGKGSLYALVIRFIRAGTPEEKAAIEKSPEWLRANALRIPSSDSLPDDDRRLSAVLRDLPSPGLITNTRVQAESATPSRIAATRDEAEKQTGANETLIRELRTRADDFLNAVPNFIVKEQIEGFFSSTRPTHWVANGVTSAEIRSENGQEVFRNVQVNGSTKTDFLKGDDLIDFFQRMGKPSSSGEFSNAVPCLLSPRANVQLQFSKADKLDGKDASVYSFSVDRDSGCLGIQAGSQVVYTAARGSLWVQPSTRDILRLDVELTDIPSAFPTDRAERQIEYRRVKIAGSEYVLAVRAYWYGCVRGTYQCWMNRMSFHDYQEFKANSSIHFGDIQ